MNTTQSFATMSVGTPVPGGFFAGGFKLDDGTAYGLAVAPKAQGQHKPAIWIPKYKEVPGAKSYNDGRANTLAMAEAGSKLAQWALGLNIDGCDDFYIPSQDELEIVYRAFKPSSEQNSLYGRSGINVSAITPTRPYTLDYPAQTQAAEFQQGGAEAFDLDAYWTSTQRAADSKDAWFQSFDDGYQVSSHTIIRLPARAVRRFPL